MNRSKPGLQNGSIYFQYSWTMFWYYRISSNGRFWNTFVSITNCK